MGKKSTPIHLDTDVRLGHRYRDRVSQFEGVAVGRFEYLNGCVRFELQGADKDGKPEGYVFDWQQLEGAEGDPIVVPTVVPTPEQPARTGGVWFDVRPPAR